MKTITYIINGLDCPHCSAKVEKALVESPEIETASINLLAKTLKISFKNKVMDVEDLNKLIAKTKDGIKVEPISETQEKKPLIDDKTFFLIGRIILSALMVVVGIFVLEPLTRDTRFGEIIWTNYYLLLGVYVFAYLFVCYDVLIKFFKTFKNPKGLLNEVTLMVVASIAAFALQHYFEAVLIMVFFQLGRLIERLSIAKSKDVIASTIDKRTEFTNKYDEYKQVVKIKSNNVTIGDVLVIKTGDIIPVDGEVVAGEGNIDTSSVTGEFVLKHVIKGEKVYSGTILKSGTIDMKATSTYESSTTSKILKLVMESSDHKTKAEKFIHKFAAFYTPIVMGLALFVATVIPLIISFVQGFTWPLWEQYIIIGLTILVTSCPCAIIISIPLAYFIGTTRAFKNGVIVKGTNYLERLNDVNIVVSDKTGTLTSGEFSVQSISLVDLDQDIFIEYLYILESKSNHPIANAIISSIEIKNVANTATNYKEIAGFGVKCEYNGHSLMAGSDKLLTKEKVNFIKAEEEGTIVYLVVDNKFEGYVVLNDSIKESSIRTIQKLKEDDIDVILLTGGKEESAKEVANALGIDHYHAEMKPEEKLDFIKDKIKNNKKGKALLYVGDGINDTPCLALADVSVSMGDIGSEASVNESDIVILNDDPYKIIETKTIARRTRNRCIFNIVFALIVKTVVVTLAFLSLVDMWVAVLSDSGLLVLLICSALLLSKIKIKK